MPSRTLAAVMVAAPDAFPVRAAADALPDEATLLSVFLIRGTLLTSYGAPDRVTDHPAFPMPHESRRHQLQPPATHPPLPDDLAPPPPYPLSHSPPLPL